jgi:hypothetical protein
MCPLSSERGNNTERFAAQKINCGRKSKREWSVHVAKVGEGLRAPVLAERIRRQNVKLGAPALFPVFLPATVSDYRRLKN